MRSGGGATCQLPSLTALLSVLPVLIIAVLFAFVPVPDAHAAAAAYLADENGQTEISVDVDDTFYVVLYVVDISGVAGYECKITVSGPATPTGSAAHGAWFADNHTVFDGIDPVPADYHTAMLISPTAISGSGAVVVYTLHADDDGIVAINVDEDYFLFAESDGDVIELDAPSTLYVTVGSGEGMLGGGESLSGVEEESEGGGMGVMGGGAGALDTGFVKYDVENNPPNGRVNILDLIAVRNSLNVGWQDVQRHQFACDVNHTQSVNVLDLLLIRNNLNKQVPVLLDKVEFALVDENNQVLRNFDPLNLADGWDDCMTAFTNQAII